MIAVYQVPNGYDNTTLKHTQKSERKTFAQESCQYYVTENTCLYNCPDQYKYVNNRKCSKSCTTKYFVRDTDFDQYLCVDTC